MPLIKKNEKISAVIPIHIYSTLKQAADIMGATISSFLVQTALEKANDILQKEQVINLSARDSEIFFQAIENPPEPSVELVKAIQEHEESFEV